MQPGPLLRVVAFVSAVGFAAAPSRAADENDADDHAAWSSVAELTRQGRQHASEGNDALATRRFAEAITLDRSYAPAYLELGRARERAGDFAEALRVYDVAVQHVPRFAAAYRARAHLERRLGMTDRAIVSLQAAAQWTDDPSALRDIASRYAEDRAWPAALAVWRRLLVIAQQANEPHEAHDAYLHIRALMLLCNELDPVAAGNADRGWVRKAVASIARGRSSAPTVRRP